MRGWGRLAGLPLPASATNGRRVQRLYPSTPVPNRPARRESAMSGRRALVLIPVTLFGLLTWLGPNATPRPRPAIEGPPAADTPVVARRGQPLPEYEEPLPAGARVRFG